MKSPIHRRARRGAASMEAALALLLVACAGTAGLQALGHGTADAIADRDSTAAVRAMIVARQAGSFDAPVKLAGHVADVTAGLVRRSESSRGILPAEGALYEASSLNWRLAREGTLIFGGQRALLLQLADPRIAAGVAKYSTFRDNPFDRLTKTLDAMMHITFGTPQERADTLALLERIHSHVRGTTADGTKYTAMDPALQFWVHATLVDTSLEVERRFNGRFTDADRARYYEETKALARAFNIPESEIPATYADFRAYVEQKFQTLRPSAESKELAGFVLRPKVWRLPPGLFTPLDWVTRDLLPAPMRKAYGLREPSRTERAAVAGIRFGVRQTVTPMALLASSVADPRGLVKLLMEQGSPAK